MGSDELGTRIRGGGEDTDTSAGWFEIRGCTVGGAGAGTGGSSSIL
jgi:hypothetical protein